MSEVKTIKATPRTLKKKIQEIKDRGERILAITPSKWKLTKRDPDEAIASEFVVVSQ